MPARRNQALSALFPRGAGLTLTVLGLLVYLGVALIEWSLGSTYHAALALGLAALFVFTGRGRQLTVGTALLLGAVLAYGLYRAAVGLRLLGVL
ncbi:hypothetical protein DKM44_13555 [Deinococcus irradiatisoli]|uniref:Uncharacterized protein n=1 Tax=Deinococcus irradiatisoli TaxID=2202254 RepID=A0A2Z3JG18_9DEIO|nr:hypothetical protein [Deinococcus irradiatisoli]AWN24123.1 hypothetical protein DKM44_13555 [Deinococcus irradiatisoli]